MLENSSHQQIPGNENMGIEDVNVIKNGSVSKLGVAVEEGRSRKSSDDGTAAGNRWPQEETLALVKVRSDMVIEFRDFGVTKAPLWEEVSSKLAVLGYHRSAKKCKEKFENIYKYHRRTKEGRNTNPNLKSYRFFDELEAFDQINPSSSIQTMPPINVSSQPQQMISSNSTNSSSGAEEVIEVKEMKRKKEKMKRGMKDFFEKIMNEVISKQEEIQNSFIESIEKFEQERIRREDSWKIQQKAQRENEQKLLVQDRAIAAAKDAAVMAFLQKFTGNKVNLPENILTPTVITTSTDETMQEVSNTTTQQIVVTNRSNASLSSSSSRWPRHEVEALIAIRSRFYDEQSEQEITNGNKGPLWEEISATMKRLYGYERGAKRCKEKWENINKYFKRVRESNKRRPEDSKTCPYFHQLEALYQRKKTTTITNKKVDNDHSKSYDLEASELLMQMMGQSEPKEIIQSNVKGDDANNDNDNDDEDDDENTGDDDDDGDTDNYQIVANDTSSRAVME